MSLTCFHCGDPIPAGVDIASNLQNSRQQFCCYGCQAIAEHICGAELSMYYERRTSDHAVRPTLEHNSAFELLEDPNIYNQYVYQSDEDHTLQVSISGITCSACAWLIEKHLSECKGVHSIHVNLSTRVASITWNPNETNPIDIAQEFLNIGYSVHPYLAGERDQQQKQEKKQAMIRLGIAGVGMMQVMMSAIAMYAGDMQGMDDIYRQLLRWISFVFATPVVLYAGLPFYRGALRDIKNLHFTMDLPVSIGILLAYGSSVMALLSQSGHVYFDSVTMFIFFLLLGRFLEAIARSYQTAHSNTGDLTAISVIKDGQTKIIPLNKLEVGDHVLVEPGQSFPADGTLLSDFTSVDESSLTGEYNPVMKQKGASISAQTTNVEQQVILEVTQVGQNTRAAAISRITSRALSEKPKVAIIADKVAHYFVIAVLLTAIGTYLFWSVQGEPEAYWIMVSVLVVTCPCALSLATPVALTTVTNSLKRAGLLITRGHVIEALANTRHIVFDKTGTLTNGAFSIQAIHKHQADLSETQIESLIAGLERQSSHPIAAAFQHTSPTAFEQLQNIPSLGVKGKSGVDEYYFGNLALMDSINIEVQQAFQPQHTGQLTLYLATSKELLAIITLSDALRPETETVLKELKHQGIRLSLLTGDTSASAHASLKQEWFDDFISDCLPEQKWDWIRQQDRNDILMIGDGLNDVPALAGTATSLAMSASSDLAKLHADAILLNDHLSIISLALKAAKKCRRIIKQNLIWAIAYNATLLPAAVAGLIPPWVAAIGMALSSLIVVINATRLTHI